MYNISWFLIFLTLFYSANSAFSGPYLFWGPRSLSNLDNHAFKTLSKEKFKKVVNNVKVVILFSTNEFMKFDKNTLPRLNEVINEREYLYLPEGKPDIDLFDERNKTKVFFLFLSVKYIFIHAVS